MECFHTSAFHIRIFFCFGWSSKGESRCFQMYTNDILDRKGMVSYISDNLFKNYDYIQILFNMYKKRIFIETIYLCIFKECMPNPCLNNGYCQTESSGNLRCYCPQGFWGMICEKGICVFLYWKLLSSTHTILNNLVFCWNLSHSIIGFCNNHSYCHNNATCVTNNETSGCLCRPGFAGKTCSWGKLYIYRV